jgi:type II secretory pathway pseudopilin PulG
MLKKKTNGTTLIEILVAIAIIMTLTVGLYVAGSYAQKQAKIKHTESTLQIISAALEQYHDFYGKFPFVAAATYNITNLQADVGNKTVWAYYVKGAYMGPAGSHKDEYSSIEALYYFLNLAPDAKKIISTLNPSFLTNKSENKIEEFRISAVIAVDEVPLVRIVDSWGTAFRYTYAPGDNFPVITSAGPDKDFGDTIVGKQEDNITSK